MTDPKHDATEALAMKLAELTNETSGDLQTKLTAITLFALSAWKSAGLGAVELANAVLATLATQPKPGGEQ